MTTSLPARCPAPVAPLPPRGSRRTGTFSMPITGTFYVPIDSEDPACPAAHEMLGRCYLDAGHSDLAVSTLAKALDLPLGREDDFLGIYYYMGRAQEASGNPEAACDFYRKTLAIDIGFQDVEARLRDLGRAPRETAGESADPAPDSPS